MEAFAVGLVVGLAIAVVLTEIGNARRNRATDKRIRERYQRGDV